MTSADSLHKAIEAVAPIIGVSIGQMDDRATWRIDFARDASEEQRAAARAVLEAFDVDAGTLLSTIAKDVIWRRASDQEAEQMEALLQAQPVRLRRIYEGATSISTEDELYSVLSAALTQLFGAHRAAELLEPTA
jgi:hypothetical protein